MLRPLQNISLLFPTSSTSSTDSSPFILMNIPEIVFFERFILLDCFFFLFLKSLSSNPTKLCKNSHIFALLKNNRMENIAIRYCLYTLLYVCFPLVARSLEQSDYCDAV